MQFKRLGITTDCVHFFDANGNVGTENHIFRRQMEALASCFEQTIICCPFKTCEANTMITTYNSSNIKFVSVPNVGGNSVKEKLRIIKTIPAWLKAFKNVARESDIVYQRFPNNLNIPGFFYFWCKKFKVFATYTGTWANYKGEPFTYRFQKWLLKSFFRGPVAAYVKEDSASGKIFKTFSPSYTLHEWEEETKQVERRIEKIKTEGIKIPVFITVGALVAQKNQQYILDAFRQLFQEGFSFKLYVVGDGILKEKYINFVKQNGLENVVHICGKKTTTELRALYRESDFVIQATLVEGFGKVPIEGFFHGVVPILNNITLASEMTGAETRGFLFDAKNEQSLMDIIKKISQDKRYLISMIENGRTYARQQTLESWTDSLYEHINLYFE